MPTPIYGTAEWAAAQASPWTGYNAQVRLHEALLRGSVSDRDLTAPPGTCADGDAYLVDATATGAWAGHDGELAVAVGANASNGWLFAGVEIEGQELYVNDEAVQIRYVAAVWVEVPLSISVLDDLTNVNAPAPADGDVLTWDAGAGEWVPAAPTGGGGSGGTYQVWVPATALTSRTTNGPSTGNSETTTNKIMVQTLDFDQSTDEFAQFQYRMPKSWNEGTVTMAFRWTATTTGNVVWGAQGVAISDDDAMDSAFGTAQTVTDGVTAANDCMESAATSAITIGGTPAEGDLVVFQVYRDADNGSDTLAADAKLLGVILTMVTNAADDS